jgi:oxygen-independent coproporphyrinogen-3 oxidase
MLSNGGYTQYEISNFARKDSRGNLMTSRHNSSYWTKEPYLGLGPAAHSYNGSQRLWNGNSVAAYCRHYAEMTIMTTSKMSLSEFGGYEVLSVEDIFNESIMLGLRTVAGVSLSSLDQSLLAEVKGEILRHCRLGNLVMEGDKIRIPSEKLFVSDGIIKDLFI